VGEGLLRATLRGETTGAWSSSLTWNWSGQLQNTKARSERETVAAVVGAWAGEMISVLTETETSQYSPLRLACLVANLEGGRPQQVGPPVHPGLGCQHLRTGSHRKDRRSKSRDGDFVGGGSNYLSSVRRMREKASQEKRATRLTDNTSHLRLAKSGAFGSR